MSDPVDVHAPVVNGAAAQSLLEVATRQVTEGPWPDALVHLRRGDEVLLDAVVGADPDTQVVIFSATKGVTNAAVATLVDEGTLDLQARVVEVVPWFTGEGKERITVEHVLLHQAGLATAPMRPIEGVDPGARRARMERWRTAHEPGESSNYHPTSAHWVLALLVEELTGQTIQGLVRDRILDPLGLTATFGGPVGDTVRRPVAVGDPIDPEVVAALQAQGINLEVMLGEAATKYLLRVGDPGILELGIPAAGLVTGAADVAAVLAALATGVPALWSDEVRHAFTHEIRSTLREPMLGAPANRSLGFHVSGEDGAAAMRGLPTSLGPRVFGQYGSGGNIAWADPDSGLAFTAFTSGLHRDPLQWMARMGELNEAAAACA